MLALSTGHEQAVAPVQPESRRTKEKVLEAAIDKWRGFVIVIGRLCLLYSVQILSNWAWLILACGFARA